MPRWILLAALLTLGATLVPAAQPAAAQGRPSTRLHAVHARVADGSRPAFRVSVQRLPKGTRVYLQRRRAGSTLWHNVERVTPRHGSVLAPRSVRGVYTYRLRAVRKRRTVTVSGGHTVRVVPVTVARGVRLWHETVTDLTHRAVQVALLQVHLGTPGVRIDAGSPQQVVGAPRASIGTQANALGAVGGINADFFDLASPAAVPRGVLIRSGRLQKSPRPGWEANLSITANGTARIGPLKFTGSVTRRADLTRRASTHPIYALNTAKDAANGHLTLITADLAGTALPAGCTVAIGVTDAAGSRITAVGAGIRRLSRMSATTWALAACGGTVASWITWALRPGDPVSLSVHVAGGQPRAAVSGGRVLIQHGRTYADVRGRILGDDRPNPETFACVSASGRWVLLGAIDGRSSRSAGVSYSQLTRYLLGRHCYSAMAFDGGGSTTLVARLPGHRGTQVQNVPSDGRQRAVADGLFVYAG